MSMVKIVSPSDWDWDWAPAALVKVASDGGLRGHDRLEFVKRAAGSENVFLPYLDKIKFAVDEEPVHLIAMGAFEKFGANRNADSWSSDELAKSHGTFVKFAKMYRGHRNKDPLKSYGIIKASAFNDAMQRVELLVGLNKTAEAAKRNEGLVADEELAELETKRSFDVSMACRVGFDCCSACGNKARTRADYCKAASCPGGGCTDNLGKLVKLGNDLHLLHVDNPDSVFFDMSKVWRGADRTAKAGRADWLNKTAADGHVLGGAKLAEDLGLVAPLAVTLAQLSAAPLLNRAHVLEQIKLAHAFDALENTPSEHLPVSVKRAFDPGLQPPLDLTPLTQNRQDKLASSLAALADEKIVLSLRDFAVATKRDALSKEAAPYARGAYQRLLADGTLETRLHGGKYDLHNQVTTERQKQAAYHLAPMHSLDRCAVQRRCELSSLRGLGQPALIDINNEKCAAAPDPACEELVRDYATYKVAALHRIAASDDDYLLTCRLALAL